MSEHRTYTDAEAAQITRRIGQAFDFVLDMINDPAALEEIPSGSQLRFSEVTIGDITFHLTAYPDATQFWSWTARVTAPAKWAAEGRQPFDASSGAGGTWGSPPTHPEHGHTPEEALASLEEKLRDARHRFEAGKLPGRRSA